MERKNSEGFRPHNLKGNDAGQSIFRLEDYNVVSEAADVVRKKLRQDFVDNMGA